MKIIVNEDGEVKQIVKLPRLQEGRNENRTDYAA